MLKQSSLWPEDWNGYEISVQFDILSFVSHHNYFQLITNFIDINKTVCVWKNGVILSDSGCDIFVELNSKYIKLSVRVIDFEKQLNIKNNAYQEFAMHIYMEYYLVLKFILNNISYKV